MSFSIHPEGEINQFNRNVVQYYALSFCNLAGLQLHYVQEHSVRCPAVQVLYNTLSTSTTLAI